MHQLFHSVLTLVVQHGPKFASVADILDIVYHLLFG